MRTCVRACVCDVTVSVVVILLCFESTFGLWSHAKLNPVWETAVMKPRVFIWDLSSILRWLPYSFIFKQTFKFRTVLGLQNYCKDSTETSHTLQVQFSNFSNSVSPSYISIVHLSQLMNQTWYIIINVSPYIIQISSLFSKVPFLFWANIQDTKLHLLVIFS